MSHDLKAILSRVKSHRQARGWSQAELAERAGISRTAVSAIEGQRLVPSVAAALQLAAVLECTVEELFGSRGDSPKARWAWPAQRFPCRYWSAEVNGSTLLYPVENCSSGMVPHDGVAESADIELQSAGGAQQTLVVASCDPAAGLLAEIYARSTGKRLLVLPRSSRAALQLLEEGLVHVAGVHLCSLDDPGGNAAAVKAMGLNRGCHLIHVAHWQEGIALPAHSKLRSVRVAKSADLRWVGREEGSGARRCLDELLGERSRPRRLARDHRGVAEAIRNGWADAGICVQLASEEANLDFLALRVEPYDLCYLNELEGDPRLAALLLTIRLPAYRILLGQLPGYNAAPAGAVEAV
jgi:molybdate-binding protein/DNA-binding XRE family transcriptional regulator